MWALVESGSITKMYARPQAFKVGDNQYPANTMTLWSESELQSIGIYPVTVDNTNLKDKSYYSNTDITYAVDGINGLLSFLSLAHLSHSPSRVHVHCIGPCILFIV